ncbi:MAG: ABC transporter ATP-binding protein [Actinomycetota bacterium]
MAKRFKLVHERNSSLKATVFNGFRRIQFEEFWALAGIDLEVPEGSTFGLIGHNGSGKSTLLKCMARIYRPTRGRIETVGKVSALLELGAGFHPELSGRENVFLNGSILGLSRREVSSRFDEIVSFAGLERFIDSPVKNYSSGMYVRLGFAVAINVEPDILLVDEVLAVGDESFQQRCMEKFADLRRDGRTVVVVSHGMESIRNICDQAAWLDHGKLIETGSAGHVVDAYLSSVRDERREREQLHPSDHGSSGEAGAWHVAAVSLRGGDAQPTDIVESGDGACFDVTVEAPRAEAITLSLGIYRSDGVHVAGPVHKLRTPGPGTFTFSYRTPHLPLTPGVYDVNVALMDDHEQVHYASRAKAARFDVTAASHDDSGGVLALGGTWIDPEDQEIG